MSDDEIPEADRAEGAPHPRMTEDVLGQDAAETQVLDALSGGRVHHAWLLTGPEGVGKATFGWHVARYMLATPVGDDGGLFGDAPPAPTSLRVDPENPVARRVTALSEPRLFLLRRAWDPDKKKLKTQIGVDDVRKMKSFFSLSAAEGGRRVALIDSADDLTVAAANALLKVLEEPPKDAVLILISHSPSKLLPTIRSRCRQVRLSSLDPNTLANVVRNAGIEAPDPERLAALADGSAGDAIRLINLDGVTLYAKLIETLATAPSMQRSRMLAMIEPMAARGAEEKLRLFVRLIELCLARMARSGAGAPIAFEGARGEREVFAKLSPTPHAARAWANLQQEVAARASHAMAVNIDPHQMLLDIFVRIDQTASDLTAPALP